MLCECASGHPCCVCVTRGRVDAGVSFFFFHTFPMSLLVISPSIKEPNLSSSCFLNIINYKTKCLSSLFVVVPRPLKYHSVEADLCLAEWKMCRLGEIKHLAVCQTELSFRTFTPAESLMRVHSVRKGFLNLRLWEIEGCAQIYASAANCINSLLTGPFLGGESV